MIQQKNLSFFLCAFLALATQLHTYATDRVVNPISDPYYTIQQAYDTTVVVTDNDSVTVTMPSYASPGIAMVKAINNKTSVQEWPGSLVPYGTIMTISYIVTNTSNATIIDFRVVDDQGYTIYQPKTSLDPHETVTCTAMVLAPELNVVHHNIATVTALDYYGRYVTATASAYALSISVGLYRLNWAGICGNTSTQNYMIGSYNSTDMLHNSLNCWLIEELPTPTAHLSSQLDMGSQTIMDSAIYNNETGMNIALLTYNQNTRTSAIILAKEENSSLVLYNTQTLPSIAFKLQWFVAPNNIPYIITDQQNALALYAVNLSSHTMALATTTTNLAAGYPSSFLYWLIQNGQIYIVQGFNQTDIATYNVSFTIPAIEEGKVTHMNGSYRDITACSTYYNHLILGGILTNYEARVARYYINSSGYLNAPIATKKIDAANSIHWLERCRCNDSTIMADAHILVGTDNGLYSLDPNNLQIKASYTNLLNNDWLNACWCCGSNLGLCSASNSNKLATIFNETGTSFIKLLQL